MTTISNEISGMRRNYTISMVFAFLFLVFWLVETIFFLIRDGWHWKAISNEEVLADNIATVFLAVALLAFLFAVNRLVSIFVNASSVTVSNETPSDEVQDDGSDCGRKL